MSLATFPPGSDPIGQFQLLVGSEVGWGLSFVHILPGVSLGWLRKVYIQGAVARWCIDYLFQISYLCGFSFNAGGLLFRPLSIAALERLPDATLVVVTLTPCVEEFPGQVWKYNNYCRFGFVFRCSYLFIYIYFRSKNNTFYTGG